MNDVTSSETPRSQSFESSDVAVHASLGVRRAFNGIDNRLRLQALGRRLDEFGPLAVRHSTSGFFDDRPSIWLDDDSLLRMKLFWPQPAVLAAAVSLHFKDSIGWILWARNTNGERVVLAGWLARIGPASPAGVAPTSELATTR